MAPPGTLLLINRQMGEDSGKGKAGGEVADIETKGDRDEEEPEVLLPAAWGTCLSEAKRVQLHFERTGTLVHVGQVV